MGVDGKIFLGEGIVVDTLCVPEHLRKHLPIDRDQTSGTNRFQLIPCEKSKLKSKFGCCVPISINAKMRPDVGHVTNFTERREFDCDYTNHFTKVGGYDWLEDKCLEVVKAALKWVDSCDGCWSEDEELMEHSQDEINQIQSEIGKVLLDPNVSMPGIWFVVTYN